MQNLPARSIFVNSLFKYLRKKGISNTSLKHYKSDILHFSNWLSKKASEKGVITDNLLELTDLIHSKQAKLYKIYLRKSNFSVKTINRKLSSLRQLAKYLQSIKVVNSNFMEGVANITTRKKPSVHPAIKHFKLHLIEQDVSKITIKNYLVDVRQFIAWLEKQETVSSPS